MTCQSLREAILDVARNQAVGPGTAAAVETHVAHCAACAALLARERELSAGLRALAASTGESASPAIEEHLQAAFRAHHRLDSASPARGWWLRAAAALILVSGAALWWRSSGVRPDHIPEGTQRAGAQNTIIEGFVPLPVAAGLPDFESGSIVRVEIPVASLPSYGIEMVPDARRTPVQADLLVGQDGQARAIRLVSSGGVDRTVTP